MQRFIKKCVKIKKEDLEQEKQLVEKAKGDANAFGSHFYFVS